MHVHGKGIVFGGRAKKFRATKYSKAAFQKVVGKMPPTPSTYGTARGWEGNAMGGGGRGHILQLDWMKWRTFTFLGVPYFLAFISLGSGLAQSIQHCFRYCSMTK